MTSCAASAAASEVQRQTDSHTHTYTHRRGGGERQPHERKKGEKKNEKRDKNLAYLVNRCEVFVCACVCVYIVAVISDIAVKQPVYCKGGRGGGLH